MDTCKKAFHVEPFVGPSRETHSLHFLRFSLQQTSPHDFHVAGLRSGENPRRIMADSAMDLRKIAVAGCQSRLTASSTISVGCSKSFSLRKANAGPSTVWTDEKHNLYLNSLEASFVKELQHPIALCGCPQEIIRGAHSYQQLPSRNCTCSPQFMGLRHGCRTKEKNEHLLESTADSNALQRNTRTCFTSTVRQHNAASHVAQQKISHCSKLSLEAGTSGVALGLARSSEMQPTCCLCHLGVGAIIEASDQNFVDEGHRDKLFSVSMPKRLKTVEADALSDDQKMSNVVRFGKSYN